MVRRDRVRDRTDRGDRDVRFKICFVVFSSHLSSSFVVSDEMSLVSLSLVLFLNAVRDDEVNKDGKEKGERTRAIIIIME